MRPSSAEVHDFIQSKKFTVRQMDNGDHIVEGPHPNSPDHRMSLTYRRNVMVSGSVTPKPTGPSPIQKEIAEKAARGARTSSKQKAQLAKKQERSASANPKKGNRTQR
jgi:hypothetical protein